MAKSSKTIIKLRRNDAAIVFVENEGFSFYIPQHEGELPQEVLFLSAMLLKSEDQAFMEQVIKDVFHKDEKVN